MHTIPELAAAAAARLREKHIRPLDSYPKPVIVISTAYPGVWLEHLYDAIMWAKLTPDGIAIMKNTIEMFIENQAENGQLPCYVWDTQIGFAQIQECVSFGRLAMEAYRISGDRALLAKCYDAAAAWVGWLRANRMVTGRGLIEMFVGYDTGHDNSGRLTGMRYHGNFNRANAAILPDDPTVPILAVDMNCNFYATLTALADMADILGIEADWRAQAAEVKAKMFELLYDEHDAFFYDVDRDGNKRKYLSSTILHLFLEHVLDPAEDAAVIAEILRRHVLNPAEFWTAVPFPSMAACDPSIEGHKDRNCWGYFSQALIALRCTLWMDDYGLTAEFDTLCRVWLERWTACFDTLKFGQELDPHTGDPSPSSEWYSSCMLFYMYAARRLGYIK